MKGIVFFVLVFFHTLMPYAQNSLDGTYYSESGIEIKILGDKFYYIIDQTHMIVFYTDTLAECSIKRIGDFIELNSRNLFEAGHEGETITQMSDSSITDSIIVSFDLPCERDIDIEIHASLNYISTPYVTRLNYSEKNCLVRLPKETKSFFYLIRPKDLAPSLYGGVLHSIIDYISDIKITQGRNKIRIHSPAINDAFFDREYVVGEYARINGDTIFWRGEDFIKGENYRKARGH